MSRRPFATLDHPIIGTPDIDGTVVRLAEQLGVAPVYGGAHPDHGTCNYLLGLGERCYLELLGPDTEARQVDDIGRMIRQLPGERLIGIGLETDNIDEVAVRAASLGIAVEGIEHGTRARPGGSTMAWRSLRASPDVLPGFLLFAIDWGATPHPSLGLPQLSLESLEVRSGTNIAGRFIRDVLGASIPTHSGSPAARLLAEIRSVRTDVRFSSTGDPVVTSRTAINAK